MSAGMRLNIKCGKEEEENEYNKHGKNNKKYYFYKEHLRNSNIFCKENT